MRQLDSHVILEPKDCRAEKGPLHNIHCSICAGGLAYCVNCHGGEADLEEDCSKRRYRLGYIHPLTLPDNAGNLKGLAQTCIETIERNLKRWVLWFPNPRSHVEICREDLLALVHFAKIGLAKE